QLAGRLGGGDPAIGIEHVVQPAVREQFGVEDALVGIVAHAAMGLQHHRPCPVAEQDAGGAIAPVQKARHGLGPDQQNGARRAGADQAVGDRHAVDEAGTNGLHVEGRAMAHAQPRLHDGGGGGKTFIRRGGGTDDHVQLAGIDAGILQRLARRAQSQVGGLFALKRNVALADPGALANPLIRGLDLLGQIVIGDDVGRQTGAAADDARTDHGRAFHNSAARAPALSAEMAERSVVMRALISARAMSMAMSTALAKPTASALPWLFTTTPLRPRKTPPFWVRGSSLRRSMSRAPDAIAAPMRDRIELFSAWRR